MQAVEGCLDWSQAYMTMLLDHSRQLLTACKRRQPCPKLWHFRNNDDYDKTLKLTQSWCLVEAGSTAGFMYHACLSTVCTALYKRLQAQKMTYDMSYNQSFCRWPDRTADLDSPNYSGCWCQPMMNCHSCTNDRSIQHIKVAACIPGEAQGNTADSSTTGAEHLQEQR